MHKRHNKALSFSTHIRYVYVFTSMFSILLSTFFWRNLSFGQFRRGGATLFMRGKNAPPLLNWPNKRLCVNSFSMFTSKKYSHTCVNVWIVLVCSRPKKYPHTCVNVWIVLVCSHPKKYPHTCVNVGIVLVCSRSKSIHTRMWMCE